MEDPKKRVQYYKDLLNYLHDDIFVIDENFVITDFNKNEYQSSGYTRSEIIGRFCYEVSHGAGQPCSGRHHQCLHREIFRTGKPGRILHHHRSRDGDARWIDIIAAPLKNREGRVTHVIESMRDVTELKTLEIGLIQIQKMEDLGILAGGIAHDFNNILSVMLGIVELRLSKALEAHPAQNDLNRLRELIDKAVKLVGQILAFSRKQTLKPTPININRNVTNIIQLLGESVLENIEFSFDLAENLRLTNADSNQVDQVIMNLCINSRDAMPGGGKIKARTENVDLDDSFCQDHPGAKPGRYVLISISDDGNGMDEKTLKKIFDPFFTTKEPGVGTGLGLAVVYGIIKQHKGMVYACSKPGEGTTVDVFFPAIQ